MRKRILLLLAFCAITAILAYATLVRKVYYKEVKIESSMLQVNSKLEDIKKVAEWYLPFATEDTSSNVFTNGAPPTLTGKEYTIAIEKQLPGSVWYKVSGKGKTKLIVYSIISDSARLCRVRINYESTLWANLFGEDEITVNAKKSLLNLEEYFTDTKKMYGYEIEMSQVLDTAFLFLSGVVPNAKKREGTRKLFESLIDNAKSKNAGYNGIRIFFYNAADKDSTQLFAGIGITNTSSVYDPKDDQVALKRMPYKTKLLVAYYQGAYKELHHAFSKLEEYKNDHNLTVVAMPFTKFLTDGYDFADDQIIQANVCYPIF